MQEEKCCEEDKEYKILKFVGIFIDSWMKPMANISSKSRTSSRMFRLLFSNWYISNYNEIIQSRNTIGWRIEKLWRVNDCQNDKSSCMSLL